MSIAHLTFACSDVEISAEFLESVLDWRRLPIPDNADVNLVWLEIADGQELHLIEVPDFEPSPFEREFGRHLAILRSTADIQTIRQRLQQRNCPTIDPIRPTPHERFFFREPAGYMIEVINSDQFQPGG